MSKINKISVQKMLAKAKEELSKHAVSPEVLKIIGMLFNLIGVLLAIAFEKKTKKDSKNSSKPPSQTDKDESSLDQGNKEKGQRKGKDENDTMASNTTVEENITISEVNRCDVCGADLSDVPSHACEQRVEYDIVFHRVDNVVESEVKRCPECQSITKGDFPDNMAGPIQYSTGIKAYIVNLVLCQMLSLSRARNLLKTIMGIEISEASILNFILRLHQSLAEWEASATNKLLSSQVINVDETSLRVNKKNHWVHSYSSGDIVLKFVHKKRGTQAIDDIHIIPRYGGVIVHDCWSPYFTYQGCKHALCGSHLLRELTFVIDSNQYAWAKRMKKLLQSACKDVSNSKRKKLTKKGYARLQRHYRSIITRGEKEMPAILSNPDGRRGKVAKSDAHNLWERMKKHELDILRFARNAYVPFTNNRAEQDLRMAKVKQKVSGCFRNEKHAQAYARISSYVQTMRNKGFNALVAIEMAFQGNIVDI